MPPPLTPPQVAERMLNILTPQCPSNPQTLRHVTAYVDTMERNTFDADGVANDFVGTAHLLVAETSTRTEETTYRTKPFVYILRNGTDLFLRELNPAQELYAIRNLVEVPRQAGPTQRYGPSLVAPNLQQAERFAAEHVAGFSLSFFIGQIDGAPGPELEVWSRRLTSLGSLSLTALPPY